MPNYAHTYVYCLLGIQSFSHIAFYSNSLMVFPHFPSWESEASQPSLQHFLLSMSSCNFDAKYDVFFISYGFINTSNDNKYQ